MCLFNTIIVFVTFAVIITYNEMQSYRLWASSGVCFLLGLNEAATLLCISTMCGFQWNSKSIPFSIRNGVQSFGVVFYLIIAAYATTKETQRVLFIVSGLFGVASWLILFVWFKFRSTESNKTEEILARTNTMLKEH